jgi:mannose-1-phosphate guanylyltransferase/mannose-6-phosphate isomerase
VSVPIIPAIMSGGAGTRLWPLSTEARPKQFSALGGADSLFAATVKRVSGSAGGIAFAPPMVLCNAAHAEHVRAGLEEAGAKAAAIVFEPEARNTAAVSVVAAALAAEIDPNALVLLLPADHLIADEAAFHAALERAAPIARERIVTFGIAPNRPATGYGYIKRGSTLAEGVFAIDAFKEKPDEVTARAYLADSSYSWNAGIFLFAPMVLLGEFDLSPEVRHYALQSLENAARAGDAISLDAAAFARAPALPVDIAVMEKTKRAAVAPCDIGWADVGAWDEVWRLSPKDSAGNALSGPAAILDGENNLILSSGVKVCAAGVSDLVIVATRDGVIVLPRARAQDAKLLREEAEKLSGGR